MNIIQIQTGSLNWLSKQWVIHMQSIVLYKVMISCKGILVCKEDTSGFIHYIKCLRRIDRPEDHSVKV